MSHTIFLLGAVIVTCFLPEKVFCYEYKGVTYLEKDVLDTEGLIITVDHSKFQTIDEPIKGPHEEDNFNAVCMPMKNNAIAKDFLKPENVKLGGLGNVQFKSWIGFLTCFVPQTTFGLHVVRRSYSIMGKVQLVYHNGVDGMIKTKKFQFPKGNGESPEMVDGAKITVETFSPYLKLDKNYLRFKGTYKSLGLGRVGYRIVNMQEITSDEMEVTEKNTDK